MSEIKLNKRYKYAGDIFQKLVDVGLDIEVATDFLRASIRTDFGRAIMKGVSYEY